MRPEPRIGYVAKVFPRRSETFVVNEILGHERAGLAVDVFSLRPSDEFGTHASHGRLQATVTDLPQQATVGALVDAAAACAEFADPVWLLDEARDLSARELLQVLRLARMVRERGITHLHAHFANVAATVTRLAARLAGVPYSVTCHAKDIFCDDVDEAALGRLLGDAAAAITVSDYNVTDLAVRHPASADRLHRVYNGLELDRFPYDSPRTRPARIVAVGRLVEKKGFDDLLRACAILRDGERREVRCTIVGSGVQGEALRALSAELGLDDLVTFTGPASQEEVRAHVSAAAVMAVPCVVAEDGNRDGLPTVLLEALALGTPCVATPVTGIREVIAHGRTGLLVPERTPTALADALARLLDDADERVALAEAGRALVEERFDATGTTAKWRAAVLASTTDREVEDAHRVRVR